MFSEEQALWAISPFDGRYGKELEPLARIFSEAGLFNFRYQVEKSFLLRLSQVLGNEGLSTAVQHLPAELKGHHLARIKELERITHHDVAALVQFIQEQLPPEFRGWVHLGLTSEDVNNLALVRVLLEGKELVLAEARRLVQGLLELAETHAETLLLGRTHGEAATPTTLGKEMAVFAVRMAKAGAAFQRVRLEGKLLGATGAMNALAAVLDETDWLRFSTEFVQSLGLIPNLWATQLQPGDTYATYLYALAKLMSIVEDLDQNIWLYSLQGYLRHRVSDRSIGSSTMPHKINPILFENSEGNAQAARALAQFLAEKLPKSRLQRDLSDSTVKRRLGEVLAGAWLALNKAAEGISRLQVNHERLAADLEANGQILSELWQLELRRRGQAEGYQKSKVAFRGKSIRLSQARKKLQQNGIGEHQLKRFLYGYAPELARRAAAECRPFLSGEADENQAYE